MSHDHHKSGSFATSMGFVLAAVGSAVGMGNLWLFPYRMAQCGGGAFLIPYFIFVALFSYVGLSAEFALGRLTGMGTVGSFDYILRQKGKKGGRILGAIPVLAVLGIAIGYSVIVGWVLRYTAGAFDGSILVADTEAVFEQMAVSFGSIPWHLLAVILTALILCLGVSHGIEKISSILMPAFFVLFIVIAIRVAFLPGAVEGYRFLLVPDWGQLTKPTTWIYAMGQAFFSLSINGAGMLIYGSYMKKSEDVVKQSVLTAILDSAAALLAAFAIIPAVFAFGIDLNRGPALLFVTLPRVFELMPGGQLFAILFFLSVAFAGLTSLVNMLETCGAALSAEAKLNRITGTLIASAVVFGVSIFLESLPGMGTWMDLVTIYIAPFGAVLCAFLIYWILGVPALESELMEGRNKPIWKGFGILGKYIYVPISAAVVLLGILYGGIG